MSSFAGIGNLSHDVNNCPRRNFTSADGQSRLDCDCDYQGRRYTKKVSIQGSVTSHERYLYRGYLQIAALDMLNRQALIRRILWDPKEPSATRPLALLQDGKLYSYGHDFLKNVTELFDETNQITITYDYSPYGAVTTSNTTNTNTNNITQPYQWSSELADPELALSYYNYRHYNPTDGRWINRDPIQEQGGWNLYLFISNSPMLWIDIVGHYSSLHASVPQLLAQGKTLTEIAALLGISIAEAVRRATPKGGKMRCTDCTPRQGTIMYRCDATGKAHGPVPTPHYHLSKVHQNPKTCECYGYPTRECVKEPPAGSIPEAVVIDGVPMFI